MRGNSFGNILLLHSFGESHGPAIGAVLDGVPAGVSLSTEHIAAALRRRRPGQSSITSQRVEEDIPEILSGTYKDTTLGTPIAVIVRNTDARSSDYNPEIRRVGHADSVWEKKFGIRDHRGGGRSSGRETVARVIAGAIAERILPDSVAITAFVTQVGSISARVPASNITRDVVDSFISRCPDAEADGRISEELRRCAIEGDSHGGVIELRIDGAPAYLGEPVFNKVKALLAAAIMSIGAVSGVTMGNAFEDVLLSGKAFHVQKAGSDAGTGLLSHGIQGGITTGERITLSIAVKPTSTVGRTALEGRHDPCIAPRIVPVIEAMTALVLADLYLARRLDTI
jgi:chorismate synthase